MISALLIANVGGPPKARQDPPKPLWTYETCKEEYLKEEKQPVDLDFLPSTAASDRTTASGNEFSTMGVTSKEQLNQTLTGAGFFQL